MITSRINDHLKYNQLKSYKEIKTSRYQRSGKTINNNHQNLDFYRI